jgi:hypothetical protein
MIWLPSSERSFNFETVSEHVLRHFYMDNVLDPKFGKFPNSHWKGKRNVQLYMTDDVCGCGGWTVNVMLIVLFVLLNVRRYTEESFSIIQRTTVSFVNVLSTVTMFLEIAIKFIWFISRWTEFTHVSCAIKCIRFATTFLKKKEGFYVVRFAVKISPVTI